MRLHQFGRMAARLRNQIWNFLLEKHLGRGTRESQSRIEVVWTEVMGRRIDAFPKLTDIQLRNVGHVSSRFRGRIALREWFLKAPWNKVYDLLEFMLGRWPSEINATDANSMLSVE